MRKLLQWIEKNAAHLSDPHRELARDLDSKVSNHDQIVNTADHLIKMVQKPYHHGFSRAENDINWLYGPSMKNAAHQSRQAREAMETALMDQIPEDVAREGFQALKHDDDWHDIETSLGQFSARDRMNAYYRKRDKN